MSERRPILCLDFDGVIHSYTSGWKGAAMIPDAPVEGAIEFIQNALYVFDVQIYSSRSGQAGGIHAMQDYIVAAARADGLTHEDAQALAGRIGWPMSKPAAMVTIDDRALTFDGTWPSIESLRAFQPWNKRAPVAV